MSSGDAGATWRRLASPTVSPITCVAIAGDGTAVAGSAAGEILVGAADVWTLAGTVAGPVTSVAASTDPVWGDGRPDLFAATGSDVLGSDDALTFASLPGLPDLSSQPWPSLAWPGVPERSLLVAGAQNAGFFEPLSQQLAARPHRTGRHRPRRRPGRPERRLPSRHRRPPGPHDERRSRARHRPAHEDAHRRRRKHPPDGDGARRRAGHGAPAAARPRPAWETAQTASWASGDWNRSLSFLLKPSLTHEYRLEFKYGEATVELAPAGTVVVTPKLATHALTPQAARRRRLPVLRLRHPHAPRRNGGPVHRPRRELATGQPAGLGETAGRAHLDEPRVRDTEGRDVSPAGAPAGHAHPRRGLEPHRDRHDPLAGQAAIT